MKRFTIYSDEQEYPAALVEFTCRTYEVIEAIKAGKFPIDQIAPLFKRASDAIQDAIKEGKSHVGKNQVVVVQGNPQGASPAGEANVASRSRSRRKDQATPGQ